MGFSNNLNNDNVKSQNNQRMYEDFLKNFNNLKIKT